ncbi:hypothetical protein ACLB2K_053291 [Fragaria x ananassa]
MEKWKAVEEHRKAKAKAYKEEFQRRQFAFQDRLAKIRMKHILTLIKQHVEKALQRQNVRPIIDKHVLAKNIELPSSQSNGEDFPLDEPTSKEEITLSVSDEEPEVKVVKIVDNNHISKTNGVPQKKEHEDRTEQSILEEEIGSNTNDDD